jgi:hypothetical protein
MNLFILDRMPVIAAQYNNDAHVRKIILEATEMMGYTFDHGKFKPWPWLHNYGNHFNHPMSKWVRASRQNFDWTLQHAYALCDEFAYRFDKKVQHKCREYIDWIAANLPLKNLSDTGSTDWPRCFGPWREKIDTSEDAIYDYRRYYMMSKRHLAVWTKREIPEWYR